MRPVRDIAEGVSPVSDAETYPRPGFRAVTPYLTVRDTEGVIAFMVAAFDAAVIRRDAHDDGTPMNAEIRLGDSLREVGEARGAWTPIPGALHVYVPDTDATFRRALAAGGVVIYPPSDLPYGERSAGVRGVADNVRYLATHRGEWGEGDAKGGGHHCGARPPWRSPPGQETVVPDYDASVPVATWCSSADSCTSSAAGASGSWSMP